MQTVQNHNLTTAAQSANRPEQASQAPASNSRASTETEQAGRQDVADRVAEAARAEQAQTGAREQLSQAVTDINQYVQSVNRELQFSVEEALPLGRSVVKVIDSATEEVIREIPSKEVLAIAQRLYEQAAEEATRAGSGLEGLIIKAEA